MKRIRAYRPSHATVVAYLALFVALSGTALAATKINSKNIANSAVTTKKIHKKDVTEDRLADGAVTTAKIAGLAVTGSKLADDSVSSGKLESDSVASGKIQGDAVTQGKIAPGAISAGKVNDGALSPAKIAQVVSDVSYSPGSIMNGDCAQTIGLPVPGLQDGDDVLLYPRDSFTGWPSGIFLDAYGPSADNSGQISLRVCNYSGGDFDPGALPLRVLIFR
jgi:hypothetical protein